MNISFNPRVSGGFVHHVMNDPKVENQLLELGVEKQNAHDLVKSIIICGFRDYVMDVNKSINNAKEYMERNSTQGD